MPVSVAAAYLCVWLGDRSRARQLLDSALDTARTFEIGMSLVAYEASLVAALLDLEPALLGIPPVEDRDSPLRRAAAALHDSDLLAAADALAEHGKASDEAYLRLRAGERLLAKAATRRAARSDRTCARVLSRRARDALHRAGGLAPRGRAPRSA